jgi:hypothetical protein
MDAHNREHIVLLRPGRHGLILHTLSHQDEVRAEDEFHTDNAPIPALELNLARLLIEALGAGFGTHSVSRSVPVSRSVLTNPACLDRGQDPRPGPRKRRCGAGAAATRAGYCQGSGSESGTGQKVTECSQ